MIRFKYETFSRIRSVRQSRGPRVGGSIERHKTPGRRAPKAGRIESEPARPEAKTEALHAFRFGPRNRRPLGDFRFFAVLASRFGPGEALAYDLTNGKIKAFAIGDYFTIGVLACVEAERLLINVPEQVERLNRNMGATDTALQQAPEVLQPIGVNLIPYVAFSVIDHFNLVGVVHVPVSGEFIGVYLRSGS